MTKQGAVVSPDLRKDTMVETDVGEPDYHNLSKVDYFTKNSKCFHTRTIIDSAKQSIRT